MLNMTVELQHAEAAKARAERLYACMSLKNKARFNRLLVREVAKLTRQHVKEQRGLDGKPWEKKKRAPNKQVLKKIAQQKRLRVQSSPEEGVLSYKSPRDGVKARIHQEGLSEVFTLKKQQAAAEKSATGKRLLAEATPSQLRTLKELGANVSRLQQQKGGLPQSRAGLIIRDMRGGRMRRSIARLAARSSWIIDYPARSFMGLREDEYNEVGSRIFKRILEDVANGRV